MKKINTEVTTLFIAFVAVLLAVWEGVEFRQHNRMSVKPVLSYSVSKAFGDTSSFRIGLNSVGLGPAKITGFYVYYNGKEEDKFSIPGYSTHYHNIKEGARGALVKDSNIAFSDANLTQGEVLIVGANQTLFSMDLESGNKEKDVRKAFSAVEQSTDIFVCYCSLYDDQCNVTHIGSRAELSPKNCEIDD